MLCETANGTPYFTAPEVVTIASSHSYIVDNPQLTRFIDALHGDSQYTEDFVTMSTAAQAIKFAGQLCYQSFGKRRTRDGNAYIDHIISSAHGSVLEHAYVTFLFYGVSRSLTHELVRHRHLSFSQTSQRYVAHPRFVERPECVENEVLHRQFVAIIDAAAVLYKQCLRMQEPLGGSTEQLKAARQVARYVLPNCTEAPIVVSGNLRAWRYFLNERGARFADPEIRRLAVAVYEELYKLVPEVFQDFVVSGDTVTSVHTRV